ncbi:MAG: hypothetical protein FWD71_12810 [Oscillospiraceae bacterium]|nr:hypothetical protein [Oscillospiraceae bacterium]
MTLPVVISMARVTSSADGLDCGVCERLAHQNCYALMYPRRASILVSSANAGRTMQI